MGKRVFVTVGTTQFNQLIETILQDPNVIQTLINSLNIDKIILQIGSSEMPSHDNISIPIEYYKYKNSIEHDIRQADIVISHAGAGTILQVLEAQKPLLVVINEKLMNNHQIEIAHAMEQQDYLSYCTCSTLVPALKKFANHQFKPYEKGNPSLFGEYLNHIMSV